MSTTAELVGLASALLQSAQAEKALELLAPLAEEKQDDVVYLQTFGETLLENNQVEAAYQVLIRGCELDPEAARGIEKFLYLGQIIGGEDGVAYIDIGLSRLQDQLKCIGDDTQQPDEILVELGKIYSTKEELAQYLIKKLNQGIFAQIEIWMTDLCMEPEAEAKCDSLIDTSLSLDETNAEAWSLLASIRISQQRPGDAREALTTSWALFSAKKTKLEESAHSKRQGGQDDDEASEDVSLEYVELLQPLLTLSKLAIESELYEIAILAASSSQDINESLLDAFYYEGLANLLQAKKLYCIQNKTGVDYRDFTLPSPKSKGAAAAAASDLGAEVQSFVDDARIALTNGFKIAQSGDDSAELDADVVEQVNELLKELGGPLMSELLPKRGEEEWEGWEDEIDSD